MRKIKDIIFALILFLLVGIVNVNAASVVEVADAKALKECVTTNGNTCKLTSNIVISETIIIDGNTTIDLFGNQITSSAVTAIKLNTGSLIVKDTSSESNGKIEVSGEVFRVGTKGDTTDNKDTAVLTIEEGVDVISTNDSCVVIYAGTLNTAGNLITKDGEYATITGSGNDGGTVINITAGEVTNLKDLAVYHPQAGTLNISGGTITGTTGVEVRAGSLNVTGGTITGTAVPVTVLPNGNGSTTEGAGIAIAQHNTVLEIKVAITAGTINGYSALYQSTPQENSDASIISMEVLGGTFNTINEGKVAVYSEDIKGFITGGTFNTDISEYIKTGYEVIADTNTSSYVVEKIGAKAELPTVEDEMFEEVEETTIVVSKEDATKTQTVLFDSLDKAIKEDETLANITNSNSVTVAVEVVEANVGKEIEEAIQKVAGNAKIASYLDIAVAVRKVNDRSLITNIGKLSEKIKLTVLIPENLKNSNNKIARTYYIIRRHIDENGKIVVEKLPASLLNDGNSLTFETDKFSIYALAYEDVEKEEEVKEETKEDSNENVKEELPPKTFDGITICFVIALVSFISLIGIKKYTSKLN